jgi:hypothetical protein
MNGERLGRDSKGIVAGADTQRHRKIAKKIGKSGWKPAKIDALKENDAAK